MTLFMYLLIIAGFAFNVCSCILSYISLRQKKDPVFKPVLVILACELALFVIYYLYVYSCMVKVELGYIEEVLFYLVVYTVGAAVFFYIQRSFYRLLSVRFTLRKRLVHLALSFSMTIAFLLLVFIHGAGWVDHYLVLYALTSLQFVVIGFLLALYLNRMTHRELKETLRIWIVILGVIVPVKIAAESSPAWLALSDRLFGIRWPYLGLILFATNLVMFRFLIRETIKPTLPAPAGLDEALLRRHDLTGREIEVAALLIERRSYREIGEKLFISIPTVKSHVNHIYQKMNVYSRGELLEAAAGLRK